MSENDNENKEKLIEENKDEISLKVEENHGLIDSDKLTLIEMGYNRILVENIYKNVYPVNIDEAFDYLYKNNLNQFTHTFISSSSSGLCSICLENESSHSKSKPSVKEKEEKTLKLKSPHLNYDKFNTSSLICEICEGEIDYTYLKKIKLPCSHKFCLECWEDYLKEKINNGKVYKISCMKHKCTQILDETFIKSIIGSDEELIEKYDKFLNNKKILDSNKKIKFCPIPDCDGYAEKKGLSKIVKCNYGHEFCFVCGQKPHGWKTCSKMIDKGFEEWKTHTLVKRCPYCQFWTEKQDGCNHMTCVQCNFQWCWICEKECVAGHYTFGTCKDLQFSEVYSKDDARQLLCDNCGFFCCFSWIIMKLIFLIIYLTMMPFFYLVVLMKDFYEERDEDYDCNLIYLFYYLSFLPFFICYEVLTICYVAVLSIPAIIICPYYRFLRYIFYGKIFGKLFHV